MIRKQLIETLALSEEDLKCPTILKRHPKHEELFFLLLNKKANTFTPEFVREIHSRLDVVEANPGHTLLIITSLHPNIFSGGLDLNFMLPLNTFDHTSFILEFIRLLGRMLRLCVPTVAMLNGHAMAGGCMLALSCDWRTSRNEKEKVKMALTEIEIAMYLPPGMNAVCQCKLPASVYRDMALTAKRFDVGVEGVTCGIADLVANESELLQKTIELGLKLAKYGVDKENFQRIKEEMHKNAIDCCLNKQLAPGVMGYYVNPKPRL